MDLHSLTNFAGFALIGSIFAFWGQIKNWITGFFSIFIRTDTVESFNYGLLPVLLKDSYVFRFGNSIYHSPYSKLIPRISEKIYCSIFARKDNKLFVLYRKFIPCILLSTENGVKIVYFWGTLDVPLLIKKSSEHLINKQREEYKEFGSNEGGFYVCKRSGRDLGSGGGDNQENPKANGSGFEISSPGSFFNIYDLDKHVKIVNVSYQEFKNNYEKKKKEIRYYWDKGAKNLLKEIQFFKEKRDWFFSKEIPHFRGCLLYGKPGTGKSLAIQKCAQKLNMPVCYFDISNMSNNEFVQHWESWTSSYATSLLVIEDIDVIFNGRENLLAKNLRNKNLLSFDCLINTISSGIRLDGKNKSVFLIITSNYPEKLDEALTRPGRCDIKIEMKEICKEGKKFMAENILGEWPDLIDKVVEEPNLNTAADFERYCIELAKNQIFKN